MTRTATSQDDQTLVDDSANECVDDNSNEARMPKKDLLDER